MPPKKRPQSPEERKALRKQKRLDRKLQKIEKKKQVQRDHLEREIKYGVINIEKYEKDWRDILIKVAIPRMRIELEFAWHNFERAVDCKDFTISLLIDELKDSEEQYMLNFRTHNENLEKLMDIFHDRLSELRKDYDAELQRMDERYKDEIEDTKDVSNGNTDYLKTMIYQLELGKKEHNRLKKGEFFSRIDEVDVKNQLALQKLRATLERKYQNVFEEIQTFVKHYRKRIKDRKKEYHEFKQQDDAIQELIAHQFRQIKNFHDTIRQLRQKYTDMKQTIGNQLSDLQSERQYFSNSFLTLKSKLEEDKKDDFGKLALLSESCGTAFDYLEDLNEKGGKILSLAAVCRKLETQKEKILPFPLPTAGHADADDKNRNDRDDAEGVKPEMELFWQRMGQAHGVHYTLRREKKCLTEENRLLIDTHNEYCERLMFPPMKSYQQKVATPQVDANVEMAKYTKFGWTRHFLHRLHSRRFKEPKNV